MTKVNEAISGPLGHWINIVLFGLTTFFSSQMYAEFKDWRGALIENMSDDRVQELRITILETKQK